MGKGGMPAISSHLNFPAKYPPTNARESERYPDARQTKDPKDFSEDLSQLVSKLPAVSKLVCL